MAITLPRQGGGATRLMLGCILAHNKSVAAVGIAGKPHSDVSSVNGADNDAFINAGTPTPLAAAGPAVDLPTAIALVNAVYGVAIQHFPDAVSVDAYACGAHKTPDTANLASIVAAFPSGLSPGVAALQAPNGLAYAATGNAGVDLAATIARANVLKSAMNAHATQAGVHYTNDATNFPIATANATDLPTLLALAAALKTAINAHVIFAAGGMMVRVIPT